MNKALVTGAAGFIGTSMVDLLVNRGYDIRATDLYKPSYLNKPKYRNVEFMQSNLLDKSSLEKVTEDVETVYNIAAIFDLAAAPSLLFKVNVGGTQNLLDAAKEQGVKNFVHWSSGAIYGNDYNGFKTAEHCQAKSTDSYSVSKFLSEKVAFSYNSKDFRVAALRPGAVYGPNSKYGDAKMLYMVKQGIYLVPGAGKDKGKFKASHVHVDDVVGAALFIKEKEQFRPEATHVHQLAYNVCDSTPISSKDLVNYLWDITPNKGLLKVSKPIMSVFPTPGPVLNAFAHASEAFAKATGTNVMFEVDMVSYVTFDHMIDNSKLLKTGYVMKYPEIKPGLVDTVKWYEENNWGELSLL